MFQDMILILIGQNCAEVWLHWLLLTFTVVCLAHFAWMILPTIINSVLLFAGRDHTYQNFLSPLSVCKSC